MTMTNRTNIRTILAGVLVAIALLCSERATAQHTLSVTGGSGMSYARFYPTEVTKSVSGCESFGVSWRFYSPKPRFVGAIGLDLDFVQRGFSFAYYDNPETIVDDFGNQKVIHHYEYYTRRINSIMMPFVWQPHVYAANNRLKV